MNWSAKLQKFGLLRIWFAFAFAFLNYNDVFDIFRLNNMEDAAAPSGNSLFVSEISDDPAIERMIDHSRDISHWVAAEIVSCSSSKVIEISVF